MREYRKQDNGSSKEIRTERACQGGTEFVVRMPIALYASGFHLSVLNWGGYGKFPNSVLAIDVVLDSSRKLADGQQVEELLQGVTRFSPSLN